MDKTIEILETLRDELEVRPHTFAMAGFRQRTLEQAQALDKAISEMRAWGEMEKRIIEVLTNRGLIESFGGKWRLYNYHDATYDRLLDAFHNLKDPNA